MNKDRLIEARAKMARETVGARTGKDRKQVIERIAKRVYVTPRTIENDLKRK